MTCTFSTSQLPKVVRDYQFLTLLTSKCASRHNGVHFFDILTSKSSPRMVCFVHFGCRAKLLFKAALQSCSLKLLPKVAPRCCSPILLPKVTPKAVLQNCCPKAATLQTCSPKYLPKAILQSGSRKLLPKVASQSCGSSKLPCQAAPRSCSPGLLPKAVPQRCSPKLCPKLFSKAGAPKLRKAASQNCCRKLLPKIALQSYSPYVLPKAPFFFKAAVQSCSLKLLPKAVPRRYSPKLRPRLFSKVVTPKLRFGKPVYRNVSPKPFCKTAPESCASKLLLKAAVQKHCPKAATLQTYMPKRLPKAILQNGFPACHNCYSKLLPETYDSLNLYPKLKCLPKTILQSDFRKPLPKITIESCSPKWFIYRQIIILVVIN